MKRVYIGQLKCPSNHCVVGVVGEYEQDDEAKAALSLALGLMFGALVRAGTLKNEYGICHSTHLLVHVGASRFATMEEAAPFLRELEERQRFTRQYLEGGRN
jgi:hypothetical protein